jgi:predicted dehydrogenase
MRVGLIGLGSIGRRHLGNLLALGCDVHAYDISEEAKALARTKYPSARFYEMPNLLANVDALVIATPYDNHLEWAEEAIRCGVPFFVEKPLGSLEQLPRWREIAAMDLPVNQVGYMLRFHPKVETLRRHVSDATAGQFFLSCDMRQWPGSGYGPMLLECAHEIDLALACGAPGLVDMCDRDGDYSVRLWMGSWHVDIDAAEERYHRQWTLTRHGAEAATFFYSPEELGVEMYRDEMAHFLACVREQKPTICPLSDGLKVLEVCAQVEAMTKATA